MERCYSQFASKNVIIAVKSFLDFLKMLSECWSTELNTSICWTDGMGRETEDHKAYWQGIVWSGLVIPL